MPLEVGCCLAATAHAFSKWRKFMVSYLSSSQQCPQTMQLDAKARQCRVRPAYSKVLIVAVGAAAPWHFSHDVSMTSSPSTIVVICHGTESEARDVSCRLEIHMRTDREVRFFETIAHSFGIFQRLCQRMGGAHPHVGTDSRIDCKLEHWTSQPSRKCERTFS